MTTITHTPRHATVLRPLPAALAGAVGFATAMTTGEVLGLNADSGGASPTIGEILAYAGMALAAVALATWLGARAVSGHPDRMARYALGLAIGSAVTFVVFWSGWPQVLGSVALATALEQRRRIGGFGAMTVTAAALGSLSLVASVVVCVIG